MATIIVSLCSALIFGVFYLAHKLDKLSVELIDLQSEIERIYMLIDSLAFAVDKIQNKESEA